MEATPVPRGERLLIGSYGDGGFRVDRQRLQGPILLHADAIVPWNGEMNAEIFVPLADLEPAIELLIFGTGERFEPLPAELRMALRQAGIAVDAMATPAACRTYNVVTGDGRRAAAALLPVD